MHVDLVSPSLAGTQTSVDPIQVDAATIAIGCWKGRASLTVMVTAIECQEMLERLLIRLEGVNDSAQENVLTIDVADEVEVKVANEVEVEETNDFEMNELESENGHR